MKPNRLFSRAMTLVALMHCVALLVSGPVHAQTPSQKPLLNRDGGSVDPNIMLTMDDSGSMMFQHMPEDTVRVGSFTVASPVGGASVRMDPDDNATLGGPGSAQGVASQFLGTVAAVTNSTNYRQKLLRSADTNTIFYNPEVRYLPWPQATPGTGGVILRMANANVTAALRDPMNASGGTVNLTNVRNISNNNLVWCYRTNAQTNCATTNTAVPYDPGLYYRLRKSNGNYLDPTVSGNYDLFTINATAGTTFTKYPARTDCGTNSCTRDQERQNYANWFTYYRTRNLLARGSVAEAFAQSTNTFRLGYGRINRDTSTSIDNVNSRVIEAGVRGFNLTRKQELYDFLYSLPAVGGTPLRRAMQSVGEYYSRTDSRGPWTDTPGSVNSLTASNPKTCRRSYHILVTDGYWNDTVGTTAGLTAVGNQDNTAGTQITRPVGSSGSSYQYAASRPYLDATEDTLADYAMRYWKRDLLTGTDNKVLPTNANPAFWQHMVNFTVGLGVTGTLNPATDLPALTSGTKSWGNDQIDDLWHAAVNSRGEFFSAKDPTELAQSIRSSVGRALERDLREAGVAASSPDIVAGNRKFVPSYKTGSWSGDINAFELDANGVAAIAPLWTAESKLPPWASRKIFTWDPDSSVAVPFTWSAMSANSRTALGGTGSVAATHTTAFVDFLRGDRSLEGAGQPFRERSGLLGDFINSNPVLIKGGVNMDYGRLPTGGSGYSAFLTAKAARTGTLFVGSNDGMLHAFKDTAGASPPTPAEDGKEVFAFVPRAVYSNLEKLTDKLYGTSALFHQYFVDGPLKEADAYVRAPATAAGAAATWRNYLLGSLGAGGRAVYALDVTDSANLGASNVMWEFSSSNDGDLGHVLTPIETGVLQNGQWVAVFGNGYASSAGKAALFVVDLRSGAAQKLVVDATGSNGLGGVAVQRNAIGEITALFAGDLKGQLWKFGYNAGTASKFEISGGTAFFTATNSSGAVLPITQAPALFDHSQGGKLVVFGTGQLITDADANSTTLQSTFGVWDKVPDSFARPIARASLATRTIASVVGANNAQFYSVTGTPVDWATQRGWVIDLDSKVGLRVIYPPTPVNDELVLFQVVAPAQNVMLCDSGLGEGINLVFPAETGSNPPYKLFDTNGDGFVNSSDADVAGYGTSADGVDAILSSPLRNQSGVSADGPCAPGFYRVSFQNTGGQMTICAKKKNKAGRDRIWRRILNPPIR